MSLPPQDILKAFLSSSCYWIFVYVLLYFAKRKVARLKIDGKSYNEMLLCRHKVSYNFMFSTLKKSQADIMSRM